jgi:hypothetical protein
VDGAPCRLARPGSNWTRVLGRTRDAAVVLKTVTAYPTGCQFQIALLARRSPALSNDEWRQLHESVFRTNPHSRPGSPAGALRVGLQLPDGRKVTTLAFSRDVHDPHRLDRKPDGPVLIETGGGGGGSEWELSSQRPVWLWPLPAPAPFDLVIDWPAVGIPVARTRVDGAAIVAASAEAVPVWS